MLLRRCSSCARELPFTREHFAWRPNSKRFRGQCRSCLSARHLPSQRRYRERVGEEFVSKRRRAYYEAEKASGVHQARSSAWRAANHSRALAFERRSTRRILATPKGKIRSNVTRRIRSSLERRGLPGAGKKMSALAYSANELAAHLEALFQPGMSWSNYGKWHIDHIRPVASFEFASVADPGFKECWELQNLQPLWAAENLSKRASMPST